MQDNGSLIPPLGKVRASWALVVGIECVLLAIISSMAAYAYFTSGISLFEGSLTIFGVVFFAYFGLSFLLQVMFRLSGCEMAVIPHLFLGKPMHRCARIIHEVDRMERDHGLSLSLLNTRCFMVGIFLGMIFFTVLVATIALSIVPAWSSGALAVLFTLSGVLVRRRRMLS